MTKAKRSKRYSSAATGSSRARRSRASALKVKPA